MIIKHLTATNFLKYARLTLKDLPAQGLIAISGANESGKTAIVETLCFALFGRTFSLPPENLHRAIRWGETHAWVELDFQARDAQSYTVTRGLTLEGKQGVRLAHQGSQTVLVKGTTAVNQRIIELCGFDYRTLVDTVYLAQRENIAPPSPAQTIKAIAGISELEQVGHALEQESATHLHAIATVREQMAGLSAQLDTLQDVEATVTRLEADAVQLDTSDAQLQTNISALQQLDTQLAQSLQLLDQQAQRIAQGDLARTAAQWRTQFTDLSDTLEQTRIRANSNPTLPPATLGVRLFQLITQARERLAGYMRLQDLATACRARLTAQVSDTGATSASAALPERHAGIERALQATRRSRRRTYFGLGLTLLLAGLAGGAGWLLTNDTLLTLSAQVLALCQQLYPAWNTAQHSPWLLGSGGGFGLLALLLLWRELSLGRSIAALRVSSSELAQQIATAREQRDLLENFDAYTVPDGLMTLDKMHDSEIRYEVQHYVRGIGGAFAVLDAWDRFRGELQIALRSAFAEFDQRRMDLREAVHNQTAERELLRTQLEQLNLALGKARERRSQANQLLLLLSTLQHSVNTQERAVSVRRQSLELLRGACGETARRFNTDLRRFMGRIMPRLTLDRYHYLQLDDQLDVNVFSNEKHDFVTLGELSTGTQRQVMLALRLALAEALAEGSGTGQQSLLLDEPFAFFDAERIHQALATLPTISERLTQIWLVSQDFPADAQFNLHIHCQREDTSLVITGLPPS